jgi:hypothetical protein
MTIERGDVLMKKLVVMLTLTALLLTVFSPGCIYMKVQRPHDKNYEQTELGSKMGKSHLKSVLWLFAWGDAGTKAAAEEGGITVINHADVEYFTILLGLYGKITTVVYGD